MEIVVILVPESQLISVVWTCRNKRYIPDCSSHKANFENETAVDNGNIVVDWTLITPIAPYEQFDVDFRFASVLTKI